VKSRRPIHVWLAVFIKPLKLRARSWTQRRTHHEVRTSRAEVRRLLLVIDSQSAARNIRVTLGVPAPQDRFLSD
jgi:hypothetical protein